MSAFWPGVADKETAIREARELADTLGCSYVVAGEDKRWSVIPNQLQALGSNQVVVHPS